MADRFIPQADPAVVSYADPAVLAFVVIALALAGFLVWAAARAGRSPALTAALTAAWLAGTWMIGATGVLRQWQRVPPPMLLLVVAIVAVGAGIAWSGFGGALATRIPLVVLVGVQGFRLPLELAMHALVARRVIPPQMTYGGLNYDIVSGITAILVAALLVAGQAGRGLVLAWNLLGLALLANIVVVAILSMPMVAAFGPDRLNVFVTYAPYVWLPAVLVLAALAGHQLVFRALRLQRPGAVR
jgi:hypothetical protein